jgi:hypothetical protein
LNSVYLELRDWYNQELGLEDGAVTLSPQGVTSPRLDAPGEVYPVTGVRLVGHDKREKKEKSDRLEKVSR